MVQNSAYPKFFAYLLLWVIISVFIRPNALHALNIYSIVDEQCRVENGLIIYVDHSTVTMLNLKGQQVEFNRNSLNSILIYNALQNPIPQIILHSESGTPVDIKLLKKVYLENDHELSFIGWPIRFIDGLVEFFDLEGESHLVEQDTIFKIESNTAIPLNKPKEKQGELLNYKKLELGHQSILNCPQASEASEGAHPIIIMSDKINVSQFLSELEDGYERLNQFEDRIAYYAKPFLFEEKKRLGFVRFREPDSVLEGQLATLPYFQWTSGRPYHYQGQFKIGPLLSQWGPQLETVFGFSSEVKFHIFRASFIGNLGGLPAGNKIYTRNFSTEELLLEEESPPRLRAAFNYLLLVGADWGPYSFGVGSYYPVYGVRSRFTLREVLAFNNSPIFRFIYSTEKYDYSVILSHTEYQASDPKDDRISLLQSVPSTDPTYIKNIDLLERDPNIPFRRIEQYQFQANFIRINGEYALDDDLKLSSSFVSITGFYEDQVTQVVNGNVTSTHDNFFSFDKKRISIGLKKRLNETIAIQGILNDYQSDYQTRFAGQDENISENTIRIGGLIELIF